jgi:hypothetical protein
MARRKPITAAKYVYYIVLQPEPEGGYKGQQWEKVSSGKRRQEPFFASSGKGVEWEKVSGTFFFASGEKGVRGKGVSNLFFRSES